MATLDMYGYYGTQSSCFKERKLDLAGELVLLYIMALGESSDRLVLPTDVVECVEAVMGELLEQKFAGIGEAAPFRYYCKSPGTGILLFNLYH